MALMNVNNVGNANFVQSEWFVARITAVDTVESGTGSCVGYKHGWVEQRVCANGINYEDANEDSVENSEGFLNAAYPINGTNANVGDLVLMRIRGINESGYTIFEFIPKSGGGGGIGYVTSVQCTGGYLIVTYG
ncbi:hypothetical protein EBT25_07135 [bacterium]|nr:hypothetical protein [bacterium]